MGSECKSSPGEEVLEILTTFIIHLLVLKLSLPLKYVLATL